MKRYSILLLSLIAVNFLPNTLAWAMPNCGGSDLKFATTKTAIIIGNEYYLQHRLSTVENDLSILSAQLKSNGYAVYCFENLKLSGLSMLFSKIGSDAYAYSGDLFIYVTGHGWSDGENDYVVSIDADFSDAEKLRAGSYSLKPFAAALSNSSTRQIILVLDLCRQLSLSGSSLQPPSNIEARVQSVASRPKDIIIGYSAGFGTWSFEGEKFSPYAGALAAYMDPLLGLSAQQIFGFVQQHFLELSQGKQVPTQIPSFVSLATRDVFLSTQATGLNGMRTAEDFKEIGAHLVTNPLRDRKELNLVYNGLSTLIKRKPDSFVGGTFVKEGYRPSCPSVLAGIERKYEVTKSFDVITVFELPSSLISNSITNENKNVFAVQFDVDNDCFHSADGNPLFCFIGYGVHDRAWSLYFCDVMSEIGVKDESDADTQGSRSALITITLPGASGAIVRLYEYEDAFLMRQERFIPFRNGDLPTTSTNPEWLSKKNRH